MSEKIINDLTVVEELPLLEDIREGQLFGISSNNVSYLTHTIHKYPAKFIPHIPRWTIRKYLDGRDKTIFDPFCGSGTTQVEALINFHNSIGIDIDPLATLITKVKTTPIPEEKIHSIGNEVKRKIKIKKEGAFIPQLKTLNHWFSKDTIKQLSILRDCIEDYRDDKDIYDFLIITFSSIIRKASNADNQSQKTYVSHTHKKKPQPAIPLFLNNLDTYIQRIGELHKLVDYRNNVKIITGDSKNLTEIWRKEELPEVDLAVTSPPYIKAIDYIYNQMAEYFWVGDLFGLETQQKQNQYKSNYIGTKQLKVKEYQTIPKTNIPELDRIVTKIKEKNHKYAFIVAKFFIDMENNFKDVAQILKKDAHYILVIGNNSVSGYYISSHKFLIKCAERAGLGYVNHFGYEIRNRYMRFPRKGRGGLIKEDWILDFVND